MDKITEELEILSRRVVDDKDVDWRGVSVTARTRAAGTVQGLQMLQEIIQGFRHAQLGGATQAPAPSRKILFRFAGLDVLEHIGRGANGDVYLAYDAMLDLRVALKLQRSDGDALAHELIAEARRQAGVRHPNVASVYGAALDGGQVGVWMEYVRGETLAKRIERSAVSVDDTVAIGLELCAALRAVHQHGQVHGDLKAENVICEPGGRIVLTDFGCAREFDAEHAGAISGTLRDLAPEVLAGGRRSEASDIYALGVLLYRLCAGSYPFSAATADAQLAAQRGAYEPLRRRAPQVPRRVCAVVDRCLASAAARRYPSAAAAAKALAGAVTSPWPRRAAIAAACTGLIVFGAMIAAWRTPAAPWHSEVAFYRIADGRTGALASGNSVKVGDGIQLAFESDATAWLYVLDDDGVNAAVLFPVPRLAPKNPLPPGRSVLPRSGATQLSWTVGSDTAREEIVVIASPVAQPELDALTQAWSRAVPPADTTRSATRLSYASAPDEVSSPRLRAAVDAAVHADPEHVHYWRLQLPHAAE